MSRRHVESRLYLRPSWAVRHPKWFWWSLSNWFHGFRYGPVSRCRECGHTAYKVGPCPGALKAHP